MLMETESKTVRQSFDLQQQTLENESAILSCLRIYSSLNLELSNFETILFENATNLPRQIFKHFRKVRELIETSFNTLQSYISFNPSFIQEKDKILQQQITVMQQQLSRKKVNNFTDSDGFKEKSGTKSSFQDLKRTLESNESKQVEFLRQEIQTLKNQLRKNDSQYQIQIKKYNSKYQELQDEIEYYKQQTRKVGEYVENIEKLQIQIRIMKEIKERDQQLIQNMARKLRNVQRQKNHNFAFVSPSRQQSSYLSPSRMSYKQSPKYNLSSRFE